MRKEISNVGQLEYNLINLNEPTMDETVSDEELNAAYDESFFADENKSPFLSTAHGFNLNLNKEFRSCESSPLGSPLDNVKRISVGSGHSKTSTTKRRKLPGPAGLLPHVQTEKCVTRKKARPSNCNTLKEIDANHTTDNSVSLTQPGGCESEELELLARAKNNCGPNIWSAVEKYSILNALQMINKGHLPRGKVPVMCCFLDDVELLPTDAKAVLKDSTGSIGCTIHRTVIKEYKDQLSGCALLLLKQVSLFSPTGKKFYINVTLSNIVRVYTPDQTFPIATNSRSVGEMAAPTNPFSLDELRHLEAECLRPLSPPNMPMKRLNEVSPRIPNSTPKPGIPLTLRPRHPGSVHTTPTLKYASSSPAISTSAHITPRSTTQRFAKPVHHAASDIVSDETASAYHIRPASASTFDQSTRTIQSPRLRPGLGSLVRSCIQTPSKTIPGTQDSPEESGLCSRSPTVSLDLTQKVTGLLDDDMDELLCSVADEPTETSDV